MKIDSFIVGYLSAAVIVIGVGCCINSRKILNLEETFMATKTAVLAAISTLMTAIATEKEELAAARAEEKAQTEALIAAAKEGQDLSDIEAALNEATAQVQSIIERPAPTVDIPELTEPKVPADGDESTPATETELVNPIEGDVVDGITTPAEGENTTDYQPS